MIRSTKVKAFEALQDETINERIRALEEQKHNKELLLESRRQ